MIAATRPMGLASRMAMVASALLASAEAARLLGDEARFHRDLLLASKYAHHADKLGA